jgi:hypothetical protein
MKSKIFLHSYKISAFSNSEILNMIGTDTYNRIKQIDPHPYFQVYSICHEGLSRPRLIGETGSKPILWTRRAIQSIKDVIKNGVKFFHGHNSDNSTSNRRDIGEVVGSTEKEIDGILHHIVIAYHKPEVRDEVKKYDICSQEAYWNFFEKAGKLVARKMEELTGIALGNSAEEQPAFPGAKRLGMVQAFADTATRRVRSEKTGDGKSPDKENKMNFGDVKRAIDELNIHPSQVFSLEKIKSDNVFLKEFEKLEKEKEELQNQTKALTTENETLKKTSDEFIKKEKVFTAKDRLQNISKEISLTEKEKLYIDKAFRPERITDLTDEGLKSWIEEQREVYKIAVSTLDVNDKIPTPPGTDGEVDYTDPKYNDILQD